MVKCSISTFLITEIRNKGGLFLLVEFSVENFTSFKDKITFSMEVGERLRKHNKTHTEIVNNKRLLKNSIIFGSNGAGKSNLIFAMNRMRAIIEKDTTKITDKIPFSPFIITDKVNNTTFFECVFMYEEKEYTYSFSHNSEKFVTEKLVVRTDNKEKIHFNRDANSNIFEVPNELKEYVNKTRANRLFLSVAQDLNDELSSNVLRWFKDYLILYSNDPSFFNQELEILEDSSVKEKFVNILKFADLNIADVEVRENPTKTTPFVKKFMELIKQEVQNDLINFDEFSGEVTRKVLYIHYNVYGENGEVIKTAPIPESLDSAGTRKLISLVLTILSLQNPNKVIIMDEFDDAFHLNLSQALIKLFNTQNNQNQFILTTHELQLMDVGLRPDQIWLVEKNYKGQSDLYSLFDFKDIDSKRGDISYFKRYVKGQFGSLPNIDYEGMAQSMSLWR